MNKLKMIGLVSTLALMSACSSTNYQIKNEKSDVVDTVPKWYMSNINETEACNLDTNFIGQVKEKDKNRQCIYGVATSVSPDLNLAIEKAKMLAKAEMADIIMGKMNKESKQFITELGKTETKTIVSEVESVLVNSIKDTPVRGYEIFAQDVTLTKKGYYRAWIGLRLPLGEYNKMYNYNIEMATDAYNLKAKASDAFTKLTKEENTID
ncbi:hypothetical protein OAH34_01680 [bacterium]|nr:hypothetical protein [bacterium]